MVTQAQRLKRQQQQLRQTNVGTTTQQLQRQTKARRRGTSVAAIRRQETREQQLRQARQSKEVKEIESVVEKQEKVIKDLQEQAKERKKRAESLRERAKGSKFADIRNELREKARIEENVAEKAESLAKDVRSRISNLERVKKSAVQAKAQGRSVEEIVDQAKQAAISESQARKFISDFKRSEEVSADIIEKRQERREALKEAGVSSVSELTVEEAQKLSPSSRRALGVEVQDRELSVLEAQRIAAEQGIGVQSTLEGVRTRGGKELVFKQDAGAFVTADQPSFDISRPTAVASAELGGVLVRTPEGETVRKIPVGSRQEGGFFFADPTDFAESPLERQIIRKEERRQELRTEEGFAAATESLFLGIGSTLAETAVAAKPLATAFLSSDPVASAKASKEIERSIIQAEQALISDPVGTTTGVAKETASDITRSFTINPAFATGQAIAILGPGAISGTRAGTRFLFSRRTFARDPVPDTKIETQAVLQPTIKDGVVTTEATFLTKATTPPRFELQKSRFEQIMGKPGKKVQISKEQVRFAGTQPEFPTVIKETGEITDGLIFETRKGSKLTNFFKPRGKAQEVDLSTSISQLTPLEKKSLLKGIGAGKPVQVTDVKFLRTNVELDKLTRVTRTGKDDVKFRQPREGRAVTRQAGILGVKKLPGKPVGKDIFAESEAQFFKVVGGQADITFSTTAGRKIFRDVSDVKVMKPIIKDTKGTGTKIKKPSDIKKTPFDSGDITGSTQDLQKLTAKLTEEQAASLASLASKTEKSLVKKSKKATSRPTTTTGARQAVDIRQSITGLGISQRSSQQDIQSLFSTKLDRQTGIQSDRQLDDTMSGTMLLTSQTSTFSQAITPSQRTGTAVTTSTIQQPVTTQTFVTTTTPITPSPTPTPLPKPPKTPTMIPFPFDDPFRPKKQKKQKPYDVFVKVDRRFKKVADNLPRKQALNTGAWITDNTIPAQFKVKKDKGKIKKNPYDVPQGYFNLNRNKFRDFRRVQGRRKQLPKGQYIEKDRLRLDRAGETSKIQFERYLKSQRSRGRNVNKMNKVNFNKKIKGLI